MAEAFEALLGRGWTDGKGQRQTLGLGRSYPDMSQVGPATIGLRASD